MWRVSGAARRGSTTDITPPHPRRLVLAALSFVAAAAMLAAIEFGSWLFLSWHTPTRQDLEAIAQMGKGDFVTQTRIALELVRVEPRLATLLNPVPSVPDADLLWRNQPLATRTQPINPQPYGTSGTWTLRTDGHGCRDPEPDLARKPAATFRILCIGDSITFGFNVDQGADYPSQLGDLLRERYPGKHFEVINAGVPGWSWRQGLRFLEIEGDDLAPDAVVIGHGTNDQFFPAQTTDVERLAPLYSLTRSLWQHALFAIARTNTAHLLARVSPPRALAAEPSPGCRAQLSERGGCRRVSLAQIEDTIDSLRVLTERRGIGLILLNLDFMHTHAVEPLQRAAERNGIPLLDLVARFDGLRAADEVRRAAQLGLSPTANTAPSAKEEPRDVVLRVAVHAPGTVSVKGSAFLLGNFGFDEPLFDDGTHGDEVPRDAVWSTTLAVPPNVSKLAYQYALDGNLEFAPLPPLPSTLGVRTLAVEGPTHGPVDEFGALFLMAEETHPNAAGQHRIAEEIATALPNLPLFARFVEPDQARTRSDPNALNPPHDSPRSQI